MLDSSAKPHRPSKYTDSAKITEPYALIVNMYFYNTI